MARRKKVEVEINEEEARTEALKGIEERAKVRQRQMEAIDVRIAEIDRNREKEIEEEEEEGEEIPDDDRIDLLGMQQELEEAEEEEEEEEGEEVEEEIAPPPITLLELLTAYLEVVKSNGKTLSSPVGMGEIYLAFQVRYPTGEDFAEALYELVESAPDPVVRGYECDIQMVGEEYRSISFTPIMQPTPKRGGRPPEAAKEDIPTEKPFPQLLEDIRKGYDESLRLSRCSDQTFHEMEIKRLQAKARWEAGSKIFEIEKLLRKAAADKSLKDIAALIESLKVLREDLGYKLP